MLHNLGSPKLLKRGTKGWRSAVICIAIRVPVRHIPNPHFSSGYNGRDDDVDVDVVICLAATLSPSDPVSSNYTLVFPHILYEQLCSLLLVCFFFFLFLSLFFVPSWCFHVSGYACSHFLPFQAPSALTLPLGTALSSVTNFSELRTLVRSLWRILLSQHIQQQGCSTVYIITLVGMV